MNDSPYHPKLCAIRYTALSSITYYAISLFERADIALSVFDFSGKTAKGELPPFILDATALENLATCLRCLGASAQVCQTTQGMTEFRIFLKSQNYTIIQYPSCQGSGQEYRR